MKIKSSLLFLFSIIFLLCFFNVAKAQVGEEAIENFQSQITVNIDNSVDVIETIVYNTGSKERHGIYRDIYPYSSVKYKMAIENISVTDKNNASYVFSTSNNGSYFRIKIGDPDQTFLGQKTYVIKYHATKAVGQFENFDEIYWNVTGNEWNMPIYNASATVILPQGASVLQSSCYFGRKGSTDKCNDAGSQGGSFVVTSLGIGEGMTVSVGFPKDIVAPYTDADKVNNLFDKYLAWIVAGILPILTLIFSLLYWYKKGRDPKGTGVIVPQYDVLDDLSPLEVGGIVKENVSTKNISAEIIYLATKGYLKINQLEEKFIGLIKTTDYELIKLKDLSGVKNDFDKKLLNALFNTQPRITIASIVNSLLKKEVPDIAPAPLNQAVKLSDLKNVFYKDAQDVNKSVLDALLNKQYYKNLGRMKSMGGRMYLIIFFSIWASLFFGGMLGGFLGRSPIPIMVGIFSSVIIYGIVSYFNPAKTEKGVAAKEYLLGLKDYLQIAEKDRLLFHNAPDKKPEVFEKLLPYAMVLGVADIWAKEFEGIYTTPPSWYGGGNNVAFSAMAFSHSMSNFSSFASSSLGSSPSGSGSGGGGSSGGGGGGGGGGGW